MARKGKYHDWIVPEGLALIEGWARRGCTEEMICHNIGVSVASFSEWKKRFPELVKALKKGKEVVDIQVESALLRRALGYTIKETRVEIMPNGKRKGIEVTKDIPPDVTAQIFWLKNRRPDLWRDKQLEVDTSNAVVDTDPLSAAFERLGGKLDE